MLCLSDGQEYRTKHLTSECPLVLSVCFALCPLIVEKQLILEVSSELL